MDIRAVAHVNEMLDEFNAATRGIADRTACIKAEILSTLAFLRANNYHEPDTKVQLVDGQQMPLHWPQAAIAAHLESIGVAYPTLTAYIAVLGVYLELDYI